mmetsp:Transcript_38043/g.94544  ORF Transcript_38043/g.94544 Transcript_38043/m.94544 type:complete len:217 (+) Transcript_38043:1574-2224(+)
MSQYTAWAAPIVLLYSSCEVSPPVVLTSFASASTARYSRSSGKQKWRSEWYSRRLYDGSRSLLHARRRRVVWSRTRCGVFTLAGSSAKKYRHSAPGKELTSTEDEDRQRVSGMSRSTGMSSLSTRSNAADFTTTEYDLNSSGLAVLLATRPHLGMPPSWIGDFFPSAYSGNSDSDISLFKEGPVLEVIVPLCTPRTARRSINRSLSRAVVSAPLLW